jgi:hypothetical protein
MKAVKWTVWPLLCLLVLSPAARTQETKPPTVVMRFNSIDGLIDHVKFLTSLAGQKDAAQLIEQLIKTKIGAKGLEGVDATRPFGLYGRIGKEIDDVSGALLIPIADEKAFLNLLRGQNLKVAPEANGLYVIKTGIFIDAYLRFAHNYACITALNTAALDNKNLLDPAKVLAGAKTSAFALTIQLDQVPDQAKQIALGTAEQAIEMAKDKNIPGETPAQKAFRVAAAKEAAQLISTILKDGKELKVAVDLDKQTGDLAASFSLAGVPNSDLASGIAGLAKNPSIFAGLLKKDAILNGMGHLQLPDKLTKALGDVVEEAKTKALERIEDAGKKQQAEALCKAITPTFKAGDFDGAIVVYNQGKYYTILSATKVKDGEELGKTVRALVSDSLKDLPPGLKEKITLDADNVGGIKVTRVELPIHNQEGKHLEMVLGDLNVYVAFRSDAVLIAMGKNGLEAIKGAIAVQPAATSPVLFYDIDIARLALLIHPEHADKAKELFPNGQGGLVRFSVQGGETLTVRLVTKVAVLQLLGHMAEKKGSSN